MNDTPSSCHLPDEIICEIFRDSCFLLPDLFNLCLVSHRFLSTARRCLYSLIPVNLVEGTTEIGPDGGEWEYTVDTWKLLKSMKKNPEVAQAIEGILLHSKSGSWNKGKSDRPSGKLADSGQALSAFLQHSPRVRKIVVKDEWEDDGLYPIIAKRQPNLEYLSVHTISGNSFSLLPQQLPKLKSLRIMETVGPLPSESGGPFEYLEHFQLYSECLGFEPHSFLPSLPSSLRTLRLPLTAVIALDFSRYPSLDSLHIYAWWFPSALNASPRNLLERFTSSLSKSPSLRSLSFECDSFGKECELYLFSRDYMKKEQTPVLQTLETIRIEEEIRLERLVNVLSWNLTQNVRRIVVSIGSNRDQYGADQINAVRGIGEGRGIELVYQNDNKLLEWY